MLIMVCSLYWLGSVGLSDGLALLSVLTHHQKHLLKTNLQHIKVTDTEGLFSILPSRAYDQEVTV